VSDRLVLKCFRDWLFVFLTNGTQGQFDLVIAGHVRVFKDEVPRVVHCVCENLWACYTRIFDLWRLSFIACPLVSMKVFLFETRVIIDCSVIIVTDNNIDVADAFFAYEIDLNMREISDGGASPPIFILT
jgi:hypothetical protein